MSDSDEIFLAVEDGVDAVAARVAEILGVRGEGRRNDETGDWGYVGKGRTVDAPYGLFVGPNYLGPEAGVLQAMDAYPVTVDVQLRTHKALQAEEARLAFEAIVAAMPDVPALLLHNVEWLVAAYLPGQPTKYFEPRLTPDAEDVDIWGPWVLRQAESPDPKNP
ncbi:hypothetical protein OHA70_36725 [Kribbella sp. NBC_00382]|uniref:hypothetical protein n=1 Tax=Kribbella sp. NBC_00382 TaxID=2975967 RepID=UPI002E23B69A